MKTDYRLLLEKFLSYFVKGVSVAEFPGRIVIMGSFYKDYHMNESQKYEYERFVFDVRESVDATCKELLQNIIDDSLSDGFQYYSGGNEYGNARLQIVLESIDDIKDEDVLEGLLKSDIKMGFPSIELPIP